MTDVRSLRAYCGNKPHAVEDYPFDAETLAFKVKGKIFALMPVDTQNQPPRINLKCDPTLAEMLRNIYDAVQPGYHMNKKHWNTVIVDGSIPLEEVYEMIDHSYDLVVKSLSKQDREEIEGTSEKPAPPPRKGKKSS